MWEMTNTSIISPESASQAYIYLFIYFLQAVPTYVLPNPHECRYYYYPPSSRQTYIYWSRIMSDACLLYVTRVLPDPSDTYHCVGDCSSRDPRVLLHWCSPYERVPKPLSGSWLVGEPSRPTMAVWRQTWFRQKSVLIAPANWHRPYRGPRHRLS